MFLIDHRWKPRRLAFYEKAGLIDKEYASLQADALKNACSCGPQG